jgi:hypothetical protein
VPRKYKWERKEKQDETRAFASYSLITRSQELLVRYYIFSKKEKDDVFCLEGEQERL